VIGSEPDRQAFFLALHLRSSGKARSLQKPNFNIAPHTVESLLKSGAVLSNYALMIR